MIWDFPLALHVAEYWVDHVQFDQISRDGMPNELHFANWPWLYKIDDQLPDILIAAFFHTRRYLASLLSSPAR